MLISQLPLTHQSRGPTQIACAQGVKAPPARAMGAAACNAQCWASVFTQDGAAMGPAFGRGWAAGSISVTHAAIFFGHPHADHSVAPQKVVQPAVFGALSIVEPSRVAAGCIAGCGDACQCCSWLRFEPCWYLPQTSQRVQDRALCMHASVLCICALRPGVLWGLRAWHQCYGHRGLANEMLFSVQLRLLLHALTRVWCQ